MPREATQCRLYSAVNAAARPTAATLPAILSCSRRLRARRRMRRRRIHAAAAPRRSSRWCWCERELAGPGAGAERAVASYGPATRDDDHRDPSRAPRALVFRAAGFPTVDAPSIDDGVLDAALSGLPVDRASSVSELVSRLRLRDVDVLVLPYGSAFPVEAWPRHPRVLAPRRRARGPRWRSVPRARARSGRRRDRLGARTATDVVRARSPIGPAEPVARPASATTKLASASMPTAGSPRVFRTRARRGRSRCASRRTRTCPTSTALRALATPSRDRSCTSSTARARLADVRSRD